MLTLHSSYFSQGWLTKKQTDMLASAPVEFKFQDTLTKVLITLARKNQFIQENTLTTLEIVESPLQGIKTLHIQNCSLKILDGINNLISDKLEYSEVVSQLSIFILQINFTFTLRQWQHWTFKTIFHQFQLVFSKITMY